MNENQAQGPGALENYFFLQAIIPGVLAVMAYELVDFCLHLIRGSSYSYEPLRALSILVPMCLMTELFTYFQTRVLLKKLKRVTDFIQRVAEGHYSEKLDTRALNPFREVAESLNEMTESLASVEALRKDFIGDFSHEFKTPIVSINGFANLLLEEELPAEEQREYLQIIAEESDRLSHMAQQTLLLSRLDTQTGLTGKVTFSLDDQIRQKIILLSSSWEEKELEMEVDLPAMPCLGDPEILSHVWINLLNNAIKFTSPGGTIRVSGRREADGSCEVRIRDTGKGMTEADCRQIFNRYFQADPSHAAKGLGLGLSIVKRALELHNGQITVESKPGEGSCFTVTLPAGKEKR